jgi:hypothetical protein
MNAAVDGPVVVVVLPFGCRDHGLAWPSRGGRSTETPRSQSLGRRCAMVCARRITCVNVVATLARNGCRLRSLLHGCYTVGLDDR